MKKKEERIIEEEKLYFEEGKSKKQKRIKSILTIVLFIIFIIVTMLTSYITMNYIMLKNRNLNVDTNGDGWPDLNVDTDGDKICNVNCDNNKDNKPDYNIGYGSIIMAYFNIDTNGDKKPDTNLINQDTNNDGICDINCDTDNDNIPNINIDFNGDGIPELNIDINGDNICDINCDYKGSKTPQTNIDINDDNKAELNLDTDNDKLPDLNIAYGTNFTKAVFNIDKDNDGKADFNLLNILDENNKCKLNCDVNNYGFPTKNIDLDGDGIPDLNIALNGTNASANIDRDGDGIADDYIIDSTLITYETKEENIDLVAKTTYSFSYLGLNDIKADIVKEGWTKTKKFNITNTGKTKLTYTITWEDMVNDYHYELRPNYTLTRNNTTLSSGMVLYGVNNGTKLVDNVTINPGETHNYELTFSFNTNGTPELIKNNYNRSFYSSIKVSK